jgi:hypothetical protein
MLQKEGGQFGRKIVVALLIIVHLPTTVNVMCQNVVQLETMLIVAALHPQAQISISTIYDCRLQQGQSVMQTLKKIFLK